MADQSNNIAIQITDGVAATIQPKIISIADASDIAASSLDRLQTALNGLSGSSLDGLAKSFTKIPTNATSAANALDKLENKVITSAASFDALTVSVDKLDTSLISTGQTLIAFTALLNQATASSSAFAAASKINANVTTNVSRSLGQAGGSARQFGSLISIAEGRTLGLNRAAGSFLSTLIGGSPIIAAAFEVFGAAALLAVLVEIGAKVYEIVEAYKQLGLATVNASIAAIDAGNKQIKVQRDLISVATIARLLQQSNSGPKEISVENFAAIQEEQNSRKQILASQIALNEAGKTGLALQQARTQGVKDQIGLAKQMRDEDAAYAERQRGALRGTHTQEFSQETGAGGSIDGTEEVRNITDPKQVKAIEDALNQADTAGRGLNTELTVLNNNLQAAEKKEPLAALRDDSKAATEEIRKLNEQYNKLKGGLDFVDPSKELSFFQDAKKAESGGRFAKNERVQDYLDQKIGSAQQGVDKQQLTVGSTLNNLDDQVQSIGKYNDAQKIQAMYEKQISELQKEHIPITDALSASLQEYDAIIVNSAAYQAALVAQYRAANDPLKNYTAAQSALSKLIAEDPAHIQQYQAAFAVATKTYEDAINPLNEIATSYKRQSEALNVYGSEGKAVTEVLSIMYGLQQKGYNLTDEGQAELLKYVSALNQQKAVQEAMTGIWEQNAGALEKLTQQYQAYQKIQALGGTLNAKEKNDMLQLQLQYSKLKASMGDTSALTTWQNAAGKFLESYKGMVTGVDDLYAGLTDTIGNGLANAIGRALAYGENLGDALKDVARQAISELISGFIKLGLQWVLQQTIGMTLGKIASAQSAAQAAALAVAWATPAAFASIATLGAADAVGSAGLAGTVALSAGLAALSSAASATVPGAATGGFISGPGSGISDSILLRVSNGEAIANAAAMADSGNRRVLSAMNSGARVTTDTANAYAGRGSNSPQRIVVEDHTSGAKITLGGVTHDEVRFIARDVAQTEVRTSAPGVVATDMSNPNGRTSKAMGRNFKTQRRRNG